LQLQRANSEAVAASDLIVKREKDWLSLILIGVVLMAILVGLGYLAWKRIRK